MTSDDQLRDELDDFRRDFWRLRAEIAKVIVGQQAILPGVRLQDVGKKGARVGNDRSWANRIVKVTRRS